MLNQRLLMIQKKNTKINLIIESESDSKVYDDTPLTNHNASIIEGELLTGDIISYSFNNTQQLIGSCENEFNVTITGHPEKYNITKEYGTLTITDDDYIEPSLLLTVENSDSEYNYDVGDTITFNISAKNPYVQNQTITLTKIEGVTLSQSTFENVSGGRTALTTATYTVTEAEILQQEFTNTVTLEVGNISVNNECTVTNFKAPNPHVNIEIKSSSTPINNWYDHEVEPENGYAWQQHIYYLIKVINDGNLRITNLTTTTDLTGDTWTADSLAPGDEVIYTAEYDGVIDTDIIDNRSIILNVTATGNSPDPENYEIEEEDSIEVPTVEPEASFSVELIETSTPANGIAYGPTEQVNYKIEITNTGTVSLNTLNSIEVTIDGNTIASWSNQNYWIAPNSSSFSSFVDSFIIQNVVSSGNQLVVGVVVEYEDPITGDTITETGELDIDYNLTFGSYFNTSEITSVHLTDVNSTSDWVGSYSYDIIAYGPFYDGIEVVATSKNNPNTNPVTIFNTDRTMYSEDAEVIYANGNTDWLEYDVFYGNSDFCFYLPEQDSNEETVHLEFKSLGSTGQNIGVFAFRFFRENNNLKLGVTWYSPDTLMSLNHITVSTIKIKYKKTSDSTYSYSHSSTNVNLYNNKTIRVSAHDVYYTDWQSTYTLDVIPEFEITNSDVLVYDENGNTYSNERLILNLTSQGTTGEWTNVSFIPENINYRTEASAESIYNKYGTLDIIVKGNYYDYEYGHTYIGMFVTWHKPTN